MDDEPLPETEQFADEVELRYDAPVGPVKRAWEVRREAKAMIGYRIVFVTFHAHRLILTTPGDICAWFWLVMDTDTDRPMVEWIFGPD